MNRRACRNTAVRERSAHALSALVLSVVLFAMAALAGACSAGAATGGATTPGPVAQTRSGGADRAPAGKTVDDWTHCLQVVADLRAHPPVKPLLVLLDGSAARECTIGDAEWASGVGELGGPGVVTRNLGSRNRTTAQDLEIAKALPRVSAIVYIGVNVGRFTSSATRATIKLPPPRPLSPYRQHQYSSSHVRTPADKRLLVAKWLRTRRPYFEKNYVIAARMLERLIATCEDRGLHPVLLDLPRDMPVIGRSLDQQITRYRGTCRTLAKKHGIPFVSLNDAARLQDTDFYDLWHLVEPGRVKWQHLLCQNSVKLLGRYGLDGTGD
jgi:hypothetical protein